MASKKTDSKKGAVKISAASIAKAADIFKEPCICIKKTKYWYCMKKMPDGSLRQCDGPFKTQAICETHFCM